MNWKQWVGAVAMTLACVATGSAATVTFEDGEASGWEGPQGIGGATIVDPDLGNPGGSLHTIFNDFGITFSTTTNVAFLGDYTALPAVQMGLDVNTQYLNFFGMDVTREFVVELRDFDNPPEGLPWTSVWFKLGVLNAAEPGWHSWSVTIEDTSALELPPGWGGYGAENPETFEPELPADRTFASVLASVDEVAYTTLVPGFFFAFTDHDVAIDNVYLKPVPEPSTLALAGLGLAGFAVARMRKRRISA